MTAAKFEWDDDKDAENQAKHHVSFHEAQAAFTDPHRVIARDLSHSAAEERWCTHGAVHVSTQGHSNHWCRVLAQRKGSL